MLLFLQLLAAHLVADFILQPKWVAQNKHTPRALLTHGAIHFLCACTFVNLGMAWNVLLAVTLLVLFHISVDYAKTRLSQNGWAALLVDQTIHVCSVATVAILLSVSSSAPVQSALKAVLTSSELYLIIAAYTGVVFGGGFVVQAIANSFLANIAGDLAALKPGLPRAGTYIGWVERALVLTFIIAGFDDAIGFLLAVKALARFPEIKEDTRGSFAEYFLVGTLTSFGIGLVGGYVVKKVIARVGMP